jgi:GDP-mannose 6-dehydrogenase
MIISVVGMGYVGVVSAACLAKEGHTVIGVDSYKNKVDIINSGKSPIVEEKIDDLVAEGVVKGKLSATLDIFQAVSKSDLVFVCVGTPARENGRIDLKYIKKVSAEIGSALRNKNERISVALRSTIFPGTMQNVVIPIMEESSGKTAGKDFDLCFNPEFMREGSSVFDFYNPPKTIVGEYIHGNGDRLVEIFSGFTSEKLFKTDLQTAEMVKYVDNLYHALKISFSNEIGLVSKKLGIDSHEIMNIFCSDTKLNLSPKYFKPGYAFGGSCLPKDLKAFVYESKLLDLDLPLIRSIQQSNENQIAFAIDMIKATGKKKLGIFGISFKDGTDDLRESPLVKLVEILIGKGFKVSIYDKHVSIAKIFGSNKDYILNEIPHISTLMCESIDEVAEMSDVLVFGHKNTDNQRVFAKYGDRKHVIDLVRLTEDVKNTEANYSGICW